MTWALILGQVALAALAVAWGGRAQVLTAGLSSSLAAPRAVWLVALACSAATAWVMAQAGAAIAGGWPPIDRAMACTAGLLLAGAELAWPVRPTHPKEPTRSWGAITLVLAARQSLDAPRWLGFAVGAAWGDGPLPALAVTTGSGAALAIAAFAPRLTAGHGRAQAARRVLALAALGASAWIALHGLPGSP